MSIDLWHKYQNKTMSTSGDSSSSGSLSFSDSESSSSSNSCKDEKKTFTVTRSSQIRPSILRLSAEKKKINLRNEESDESISEDDLDVHKLISSSAVKLEKKYVEEGENNFKTRVGGTDSSMSSDQPISEENVDSNDGILGCSSLQSTEDSTDAMVFSLPHTKSEETYVNDKISFTNSDYRSGKIFNILNEYRKNKQFTDLTLQIRNSEQLFPIHRNVLASVSPFFKKKFISASTDLHAVLILNCNVQDCLFESLIEYFYTGGISFSLQESTTVNEMAIYFEMQCLESFTDKIIHENIKTETCYKILVHSINFSKADLQKDCIAFIIKNNKTFFDTYNEMLSNIELKKILRSCHQFSEEQIYSVYMNWIKVNYELRKECVEEFLVEIDFSQISDKFKLNVMLKDQILMNNFDFILNIANMYETELKSKLNIY